jgi:hypothetical protein
MAEAILTDQAFDAKHLCLVDTWHFAEYNLERLAGNNSVAQRSPHQAAMNVDACQPVMQSLLKSGKASPKGGIGHCLGDV